MSRNTVSRDDYEAIVEDVASQMYGEEVDIRDDYSGRYMRGRECLAVVGDHHVLEVFIDAARYYGADVSLGTMKEDSMGTSSVFYWEHVEVGAV